MPRKSAKPQRKERKEHGFERLNPMDSSWARVLIVGEGLTEKCYFEAIIKKYKLLKKHITITPSIYGSAPLKVVDSTNKEIERAKNDGNPYDYVFCVFDGDSEEGLKEACQKMENNEYTRAQSWPCFEYWILLHFNNSSSGFQRTGKSPCDNCIDVLKTYIHNYKKNYKNFDTLMDKTEIAVKNSKKSRQRAETDGEDNPSSEVYKVLECLKELKKTNQLPSAS